MAILLVFFYHVHLALFPNYANEHGTLSKLLRFSPSAYGGSGVQLFLLISGFLIHFNYLTSGKEFSASSFYYRRFWRIIPPYFIFLIIFYFTKEQVNAKDFVLHIFMIYNFSDDIMFQINPSFWSLALECQLYLLYPLYLFLCKKFGSGKTMAIIVLITIIFVIFQWTLEIKSASYNSNPLKYWVMWTAGAYLAEYFHQGKRLFAITGKGLCVILAIVLVLVNIPYLSLLYFYLLSFFYLLLMDWLLHAEINTNKFQFKVLTYIGMVSYSLYLFHQPFLWEFINYFRFGFYSFLITVPLVLIIYIGLASLTYRFIEKPSVELGKKWRRFVFKD